MAAITDVLSAPAGTDVPFGKYSLARFVRTEAAAAAPVVWTNISGLQNVSISPVEWGTTKEVFQEGAGDESLMIKRDPKWSGQLTFLKGQAGAQLAAFLGYTWTTGGTAAIPFYFDNDYPMMISELILRDEDNQTQLFNILVPDMVLDGFGFENPLDDSEFVLPFHTYKAPVMLPVTSQAIYDVFTGDGSTVAFTLSDTPLTLWTVANYRTADYANLYYVKEKASTASTGTLKRTGYSAATTTLTATTAPASGTKVQVLYAGGI